MTLSEKEKKTLQVAGFVAILLLVVVLYVHFMFGEMKPAQSEIEKLDKKISSLETRMTLMIELESTRAEIEALSAELLEVSKRLPLSEDTTVFYHALVDILKETGLGYNVVKRVKSARRSLYTEIPYEITLNAPYHEIGQFLNLIEENPTRIMRVTLLKIGNKNDTPTIHPITIRVSTFLLKGQKS